MASVDLKNFIVRNVRGEEEWESIGRKLLEKTKEEEEMRVREKEKREMMNMISSTVRNALETRNNYGKRDGIRCFYCDRIGHRAKDCYKRKDKEEMDCKLEKKSKIINGLDELEREFPRVFKVDGEIEYCLLEKCKIKTEEGKVIRRKGQVIEQALIGDTEKHLEDLERRKVIRDSVSSWRNPIRAIRKPNGSIRLVSNLIALNEIVEKDEYGLTNIRDVVRATQGSRFLTVLDLKDGFYSIEIEEQDKHKTAFEFNGRVYEWNSMVMGFKNSPQILQRIMDQIFRNLKGRGVAIYMDDIVIYGKTREEHDKLCREVLRRLESNNMKVNRSKIQYCREEVHQDPALRRFTLRRFEVASHTYLTPNLALRRLSFEVASLLF
jgi:hypothetical protein